MDEYKKIYDDYMAHFSDECIELLIYNENDFNKNCNFYKGTIDQHLNNYIAYKELPTGKSVAMDGMLVVPIDKKEFKCNQKCKLKNHTIYHVLVRKCLSDEIGFSSENHYLLVKILKKKVRDSALEETAKNALLPITLHVDGIGEFEWKRYRTCSSFNGQIQWCEELIGVELESDGPGTKTANRALAVLQKIYARQKELTESVFCKCAEDVARDDGMIETWQEEASFITKEEFLERISVGFIHIWQDGSMHFTIEADGIFTDHALEVEVTPAGEIVAEGFSG
ncbi:MAG: DUF2262 domain-containing protein [Oscillospiraceae bacterium]|nr:DUF2262 domain-containing protein [Oscillospiraceae bacterium]